MPSSTNSNNSNRDAGRPSHSPATMLNSTATSCRNFFQHLLAFTTTPASPRLTICGISASEAEIDNAVREMAKRLKRSEKRLKRSNSKITRIEKKQRQIPRLRRSRDQWRSIAQTQTRRAEAAEAEAEEQTFEVEQSITVTRLRRRVARLETEARNLRTERDVNHQRAERLQPLQDARNALGEFRAAPILMEPVVLSPVEDRPACAIARQEALIESARRDVGRERRPVVRARSWGVEREIGHLWWLRKTGPEKGGKGATD